MFVGNSVLSFRGHLKISHIAENERTFIWEGRGLNPIRCAIDSKKKRKKTQSCCEACRVKSPKKVLRVVIQSPRQWVHTCKHGRSIPDVDCAFEGAGRHSLQFDTELIYTTRPLLRTQKKKKKNKIKIVFFNCSRLSPCSFHNWRWTSRWASLHI